MGLLRGLLGRRRPHLEPEESLLSPGPEAAGRPRVVISIDRSWHNALGITRLALTRLVRRAGGVPRHIDYGTGPEPDDLVPVAREIVAQGDALLLSGGSDVDPDLYGGDGPAKRVNRRRDRFELALIAEARERGLPIFGICRGAQLLNVVCGGTLWTFRGDREKARLHGRFHMHPVRLEPGSLVAGAVGRTTLVTRSLHGQAVERPGKGLRPVGQAPDGVVEAVEADPAATAEWLVGVQWHPEYTAANRSEHRLIKAFVERAREHRHLA